MLLQNLNSMVLDLLVDLRDYGDIVTVNGQETTELLMSSNIVENPKQRICILQGRDGNIFAQIAETLWMLYGRNDLDWLERYIPQCKNWSDDGETWRAAYGPRLRYWQAGTDQIAQVINKLQKDPQTRQAVITLWDPAQDWIEYSKDYPCNNWLHFIVRGGELHLSVQVRSNDVMYGLSHVDFFGWSVLQELIANCIGLPVGVLAWGATSMHVYKRHYSKQAHMLELNDSYNGEYPPVVSMRENTLTDFDNRLWQIFETEEAFRYDDVLPRFPEYLPKIQPESSLLDVFEFAIVIFNYMKQGVAFELLLSAVDELPPCDVKEAMLQYLGKNYS